MVYLDFIIILKFLHLNIAELRFLLKNILANGYGRSEGVVLLFLQRAEQANRIYATVTHTDATFCGEGAHTFLKPKQEALVEFFQKFYSTCKIPIQDVAFLEADGSSDKVIGYSFSLLFSNPNLISLIVMFD